MMLALLQSLPTKYVNNVIQFRFRGITGRTTHSPTLTFKIQNILNVTLNIYQLSIYKDKYTKTILKLPMKIIAKYLISLTFRSEVLCPKLKKTKEIILNQYLYIVI